MHVDIVTQCMSTHDNQKVDVITDLLQMTHTHSKYLEWIGTPLPWCGGHRHHLDHSEIFIANINMRSGA
jgi:hypothetical protein